MIEREWERNGNNRAIVRTCVNVIVRERASRSHERSEEHTHTHTLPYWLKSVQRNDELCLKWVLICFLCFVSPCRTLCSVFAEHGVQRSMWCSTSNNYDCCIFSTLLWHCYRHSPDALSYQWWPTNKNKLNDFVLLLLLSPPPSLPLCAVWLLLKVDISSFECLN